MTQELARSNSLAAEEELVTGSKIQSDLLQLKLGHLENMEFARLFFVVCYTSSMYNPLM